jgi:hypothetical protein
VHRREGENFENQEVERALHEVGRLAHQCPRLPRTIHQRGGVRPPPAGSRTVCVRRRRAVRCGNVKSTETRRIT